MTERLTNLTGLSHAEKDALIGRLFDELDALRGVVEELRAEVKDLRGQLSKNSQNSSKPPSTDGYLSLASLFEDRWELDAENRLVMARRAIDCLNQIRQPLGHKSHILFLKGQAHRVTGQLAGAAHFFKQSAKLDPDNLHCLLALAWCHKRTDQLDRAISVMQDALRADPTSAIAHYNLACYNALTQDIDSAVIHLSMALDLHSDFRELIAAENDFDPIRNLDSFRELVEVAA